MDAKIVKIKVKLVYPQLKKLLFSLKKLEYSVGCFNSCSSALMKILDESMFGFAVFLKGNSPTEKQVSGCEIGENKLSHLERKRKEYLKLVRQKQQKIGEHIFEPLNLKLEKLESYLVEHIPGFKIIYKNYENQRKMGNKTKKRMQMQNEQIKLQILPRLVTYRAHERSLKKAFKNLPKNIFNIRFDYCSELIFFLGSNGSVFIYDLAQKKICQHIRDWPFEIIECITRRNLNFYSENSFWVVKFRKFKEIEFQASFESGSEVVTEESLQQFIHHKRGIRDYFEGFSDEIWFHKEELNDKYLLAFQFAKVNKLFLFELKFNLAKQEFKNKEIKQFLKGNSVQNLAEKAKELEKGNQFQGKVLVFSDDFCSFSLCKLHKMANLMKKKIYFIDNGINILCASDKLSDFAFSDMGNLQKMLNFYYGKEKIIPKQNPLFSVGSNKKKIKKNFSFKMKTISNIIGKTSSAITLNSELGDCSTSEDQMDSESFINSTQVQGAFVRFQDIDGLIKKENLSMFDVKDLF